MSNTLLIDGNSIGHANHNATVLTVGDLQVQAIFGVVKSVRHLAETYRDWNQLVLWDGKAQWRKELCPEYKENRKATDEVSAAHKAAYKAQSPFIHKALQLLGVRQMTCFSAEADDLGGYLSKRLTAAGSHVVCVTGDQDWIQNVNERCIWFDPIRDRKVSMNNLFEFTGYRTVEAFLDGKALQGDSSDNVKGVGGIGEKGAPDFLAEFGSVDNFFSQVDSGVFVPKKKAHILLCGSSPFTKDEWTLQYDGDPDNKAAFNRHMDAWPGQGRTIFARNRALMNLINVPAPPKEDVSIIAPTFNPVGFRVLCEKLAFASILRDFDNFIAPFERATQLAKAA